MTAHPPAIQAALRVSTLLACIALGACAGMPSELSATETACGSLPPAFDAPIICPSANKNMRSLAVGGEAVNGFSIERTADMQGGHAIRHTIARGH